MKAVHLSEKEVIAMKIINKPIPICVRPNCGNPALMRKDGSRVVTGLCKKCQSEAISSSKKEKHKINKKKIVTEFIISLNDYPEVLESLQEAGRTYIRGIEQQALYYIVDGLKRDPIFNEDAE